MEIGDWSATRDLNELYHQIRDLGLETNLAELDAFGFTVVEGALSPELTERLRSAVMLEAERRLERTFDLEQEEDLEGWTLLPYLLFKDPAFEEALLNAGPLALVTYLMGKSCRISSVASHFKGPGGFGIPLHSDTANGAVAPFPPHAQVCNCNYALTDYTETGGCLAIVPGSHRLGRQPSLHEFAVDGPNRNVDAIAVEVPAGSAVIWHGNTWHGSFTRTDPGLRINLSIYYCRQNISPQENYEEVPDAVLERQRDNPRFATLIGADTSYGWTDEGPDLAKMARSRAGRTWHS